MVYLPGGRAMRSCGVYVALSARTVVVAGSWYVVYLPTWSGLAIRSCSVTWRFVLGR